jgi:hypothetical protein
MMIAPPQSASAALFSCYFFQPPVGLVEHVPAVRLESVQSSSVSGMMTWNMECQRLGYKLVQAANGRLYGDKVPYLLSED